MRIELKSCPKCGGDISLEAPQGLCPKCLLAAVVLSTETGAADTSRVVPPALDAVAAAFPQLEILEPIGQGGMGVVYRARQKSLNRIVALKLLLPERVRAGGFADRFTSEAQALARLNHPHIVTIHDFGQAGPFFYLLMEFVDGVNLRQAMQAGRFTPEQALAIVPPLCDAMQYAHDRGIIHRDIKPENLLLDRDGSIKIADFGIAKILGETADGLATGVPAAVGGLSPTAKGGDLTQNAGAGTPGYMAPEQSTEPHKVDRRADIYSLGVVFYEMLTGELPEGRFPPPSRKVQIDVRLDEIVLRALEQSPELRFQTAAEFRTQVDTILATPGDRPRVEARADDSPRLLKTGNCMLTTPERLATLAGQLFHRRNNRWQLILDTRQLTIARGETLTVIPLSAIHDLSVGQYPRSMNPLGLDFISLTYDDHGRSRRVFFSPTEFYFGLPSTWNLGVADWLSAIREAATAATGRPPATTPAEQLGVAAGSRAWLALPLIPVLAVFASLLAITWRTDHTSSALGWVAPALFLFVLGLGLIFLPRLLQRLGGRRIGPGARRGGGWAVVNLLVLTLLGLGVGIGVLGLFYLSLKAPTRSTGASSFGFGPEFECILPKPALGAACVLDFETGARHTPPDFLAQKLAEGYAEIGTNAVNWLRACGGDAVVNMPGRNSLRLFEGAAGSVSTNANSTLSWEEISVDQVRSAVRLPTFNLKRLSENSDQVFHATPALSPAALCFITREGSIGVMEILGRTDHPGGLKLRYKLVRGQVGAVQDRHLSVPAESRPPAEPLATPSREERR